MAVVAQVKRRFVQSPNPHSRPWFTCLFGSFVCCPGQREALVPWRALARVVPAEPTRQPVHGPLGLSADLTWSWREIGRPDRSSRGAWRTSGSKACAGQPSCRPDGAAVFASSDRYVGHQVNWHNPVCRRMACSKSVQYVAIGGKACALQPQAIRQLPRCSIFLSKLLIPPRSRFHHNTLQNHDNLSLPRALCLELGQSHRRQVLFQVSTTMAF